MSLGWLIVKISEAIGILSCYLERYGDCEIVRIDRNGIGTDPVEYFEFIGGNRLLCSTDQPTDQLMKGIFIYHEKKRNEERMKEWRRDCEGDKL